MSLRASKASQSKEQSQPGAAEGKRPRSDSSFEAGGDKNGSRHRRNSGLHRLLQSPKVTPFPLVADAMFNKWAPSVYYTTIFACIVVTLAGFYPSVSKYMQTNDWYLNPYISTKEWANKMDTAMFVHCSSAFIWIGFLVFQYVVTGRAMMHFPSQPMKLAHQLGAYFGICLCVVFIGSANWFAYKHGTAGKITLNGFAIAIGVMVAAHLWMGVTAIWAKNKHDHIWHMCGLFTWACSPGLARFTSFGVQLFVLGKNCDVFYTSGALALGFAVQVLFTALLRWSLLHHPFHFADYWLYWTIMVLEGSLGFLDGSFFKCTNHPMLAQPPGKPWQLL